jgi:hypothetical protein
MEVGPAAACDISMDLSHADSNNHRHLRGSLMNLPWPYLAYSNFGSAVSAALVGHCQLTLLHNSELHQ